MRRLPFLTVRSRSAEETRRLGQALGETAMPGDVVLLLGDLGAGKTTFVQGFARGLGVSDCCSSPTFTIMHAYEGRYPLLHVDLFRCSRPQEVMDLGLDEMLEAPWVVVVEWGEKAAPLVSSDFLEVELDWDETDDAARMLQVRPFGRWRERMRTLAEVLGVRSPEGG